MLSRPDLLFGTAHEAGRLAELDWACRSAAVRGALEAGLGRAVKLFINVEPLALGTNRPERFDDLWQRAVDELDIVVEITERALTSRPAELLQAVTEIRDRGWGIALDDVGADVRSLALMPMLRPDVIKLDLRLVQEQPTAEVADIVHAVNAESERTGAVLLAEGIETEAHLTSALALGATTGQGWLFGRPGPLEQAQPATAAPPDALPAGAGSARHNALRDRPPAPRDPARGQAPAALDLDEPRTTGDRARRIRRHPQRLPERRAVHRLSPGAATRCSRPMPPSSARSASRWSRHPPRASAAPRSTRRIRSRASGASSSSAPTSPPRSSPSTSATPVPRWSGNFDFALTYERNLVIDAANALMARVTPFTS